MGRYYCDYCDIYLTHDNRDGRKQHCMGRKHLENVYAYYNQLGLASQKQLRKMMYNQLHSADTAFSSANAFYNSTQATSMPGSVSVESMFQGHVINHKPGAAASAKPEIYHRQAVPLLTILFMLALTILKKTTIWPKGYSICFSRDWADYCPKFHRNTCDWSRLGFWGWGWRWMWAWVWGPFSYTSISTKCSLHSPAPTMPIQVLQIESTGQTSNAQSQCQCPSKSNPQPQCLFSLKSHAFCHCQSETHCNSQLHSHSHSQPHSQTQPHSESHSQPHSPSNSRSHSQYDECDQHNQLHCQYQYPPKPPELAQNHSHFDSKTQPPFLRPPSRPRFLTKSLVGIKEIQANPSYHQPQPQPRPQPSLHNALMAYI
mmetsp:Transcript_21018/g.33230  ORF Transcript_21018/g.33230 Transcript_21018/m.33230 type:complete len:372 (-) Transcript_21018:125-1240(-)